MLIKQPFKQQAGIQNSYLSEPDVLPLQPHHVVDLLVWVLVTQQLAIFLSEKLHLLPQHLHLLQAVNPGGDSELLLVF